MINRRTYYDTPRIDVEVHFDTKFKIPKGT